MAMQIKQGETDATLRRVPVYLLSATDGVTPMPAQTLSVGDAKITKANMPTSEANAAGALTEIARGKYIFTFALGDIDTLGLLWLDINHTGCDPFEAVIEVTANSLYVANALTEESVGIVDSGTPAAVLDTNSITKRTGGKDFQKGGFIQLKGSIDYGLARVITATTGAVATIDPSWPAEAIGQTIDYIYRVGAQAPTTDPYDVELTSGARATLTAEMIAALKADPEWKTLLAMGNGQWSVVEPASYPGNVTMTVSDKTGGVVRGSFTLFCLTRPPVLSRVSS